MKQKSKLNETKVLVKKTHDIIRKDIIENGPQWKCESSLNNHVSKRIKKGHIAESSTCIEYNRKIIEIMNSSILEVYEYTKNEKTGEPFKKKYYIFGDTEWIVMIGEDGLMETSFPPDSCNGGYRGYLNNLKATRIK